MELKIEQKNGASVNAEDRLDLCRMLLKFGYAVEIRKEKDGNKTKTVVIAK